MPPLAIRIIKRKVNIESHGIMVVVFVLHWLKNGAVGLKAIAPTMGRLLARHLILPTYQIRVRQSSFSVNIV
jgi:hypothetical protein